MTEIPQHMQALAHANHIRSARGTLRQQIAAGSVNICDVIHDPPPEAENMTIFDLLRAQHGWATSRTVAFLYGIPPAPLAENRRVADLSDRQRNALIERLRG